MGEMRDSDWSRENLLRSDWLVLQGATITTVPAPLTSAEPIDTFLSHCSQISAGDRMQIIRDPIDTVEVKVLTSQTHTYKLGRVIRDQRFLLRTRI